MTLPLGCCALNWSTRFLLLPERSLPVHHSVSPCLLKSAAAADVPPPWGAPPPPPPPHAAATKRAPMDAAAMRTRRAGRTKVIQASLRCREDTHSLVPPRHTRGNLTEKRYFSHVAFR